MYFNYPVITVFILTLGLNSTNLIKFLAPLIKNTKTNLLTGFVGDERVILKITADRF